jgi:hypothetical protein
MVLPEFNIARHMSISLRVYYSRDDEKNMFGSFGSRDVGRKHKAVCI